MGLLDALDSINPQTIAALMAAFSNGPNVVPQTMEGIKMGQQRQKDINTSNYTRDFMRELANSPSDPTTGMLAKQYQLSSMPDTVQQLQVNRTPYDKNNALNELSYDSGQLGDKTTTNVVSTPNPEKQILQQEIFGDLQKMAKKYENPMHGMAEGLAMIDKKYPDANIDPHTMTTMFQLAYSKNMGQQSAISNVLKDMIKAKDALKEKQSEFSQKTTSQKNDTYSLSKRILESKLGRPATDEEIQKGMEESAARGTQLKTEATERGKQAGGFTEWTPEAKQQAFMFNMITKEPPVSTKGMAAGDRKVYAKEYYQWQTDKGYKPGDIALMQSDYRAGDMSLKNMSKQEAPMAAFVGNINKQIDKVSALYDNNDRTGIRLLDLPVRELKVRAVGSGEEAVKASYLLEISNEIGKLSSGASGSVQQLSDSAKEDWKKVHDVNLSFKEIMKVVNATRDQANMRMQSWRDAKEEVRSMIGGLGTSGPSAGGENNPGNIMNPGGESSGRRNYNSPEEGKIAIPILLLTDKNYKGKTVDSAMRTYSNNGYGGEIVPEIQNKPLTSLTAPEMTKLTQAIIKREGNPKTQQATPGSQPSVYKIGEIKDVPGKGTFRYIGGDKWQKQ